jgi:phage baseplate assembly protein gpV
MGLNDDLYQTIADIVRRETLYLRHYTAKVMNNVDPDRRKKVQVSCDELGWSGRGMRWVFPRQLHQMIVPQIGEHVEIYFMNGDSNRPVYIGAACEFEGMVPEGHDNRGTTHILYENPVKHHGIAYDQAKGEMTIKFDSLLLGAAASEPGVLGTQLNNYLTQLVNNMINVHVQGGVTVGAGMTGVPTVPASSPSGQLSAKVKLA